MHTGDKGAQNHLAGVGPDSTRSKLEDTKGVGRDKEH